MSAILRVFDGRAALAAAGIGLASAAERSRARLDAGPPAWSGLVEKDITQATKLLRTLGAFAAAVPSPISPEPPLGKSMMASGR